MKRWRTVALEGVLTDDNRLLLAIDVPGRVTLRWAPGGPGHVGARVVGSAKLRKRGHEVQALLGPRYRAAQLDLDGAPSHVLVSEEDPEPEFVTVFNQPGVRGLTAGPGIRSPWAQLRGPS